MKISSYFELARISLSALLRKPANTTGSCLCGDIEWAIEGKFLGCACCYCSICRAVSGTAHATIGVVKNENFRWIKGEENIVNFSSSDDGRRNFCTRCGSAVPHSDTDSPFTMVQMGCLDGESHILPQIHLFTGSCASWFRIPEDSRPCHETYPEWVQSAPFEPSPMGSESGGCLCRKVKFQLSQDVSDIKQCSCSFCQKSSGSMFSTNAKVNSNTFSWSSGKQFVKTYSLPNKNVYRSFCEFCGSFLPTIEGDEVNIPMGSVQEN